MLASPWAPAYSADRAIVVIGDSLSSGYGLNGDRSWVDMLEDQLGSQAYGYKVVNASIAGDTSAGGRARLPRLLETHEPAIVIIELGGNDGLRGFPPQVMKDNLRAIIETARGRGAEVVLLGIRIPTNYGPRYTRAFEGVYRELATELEIPWIEFFMEGVALNEALMQDDGIHPNAEAQPVLLDNAWPIIREALEGTGLKAGS